MLITQSNTPLAFACMSIGAREKKVNSKNKNNNHG